MRLRTAFFVVWSLAVSLDALGKDAMAKDAKAGDEVFEGPVPSLRIEIPPEGTAILRRYHQVWRQTRPERIDVRATVREGDTVYKDVAIHLKGSFSYQPFDGRPSLTLNFDKFVPGQRFHGLTKIHLNNAVQDPSGLCEQFARELFKDVGIPCPRATPALLRLNDREMGVYVLVEGANKRFVQHNFAADAAKGNLYDGGSGGDVTKDLNVLSGANPADRSDLKALAEAAEERDPARRQARLEAVLDVDEFVTFAALEALLVHWDGYAIGCNNYRVFHDAARDKMVFIPHGMDQLFGTSSSTSLSVTPVFRGMVAKALFTVPEARAKYLKRIEELSAKECSVEALHGRVDRLAKRLEAALAREQRPMFDDAAQELKARIAQRLESIAQQLKTPKRPLAFAKDGTARLIGAWRFKSDPSYTARAGRTVIDKREVMRITSGGGGTEAGGTWRTTALLDEGHYEFTGLVRTRGLAVEKGAAPAGVMLRMSGDKSTDGILVSEEWKPMSYAFDVRGIEEVELVCEFRGADGMGEFDVGSLRLVRKGLVTKPAAGAAGAVRK